MQLSPTSLVHSIRNTTCWCCLITLQLYCDISCASSQDPFETTAPEPPTAEILQQVEELHRLWNSEQLVISQVERLGGTIKRKPIGGILEPYLDPEKREFVHELRVLRQRNAVPAAGGAELTSHAVRFVPYFRQLRRLSLDASLATDDDLKTISKIEGITTLILYDANAITDEGIQYLAQLPNLMVLQVYNANIGDQSLEHLQTSATLYELYLTSDRFTNAATAYASRIKGLAKLSLVGGDINDRGLDSLYQLEQLSYLDLSSTKITPAAIDSIGQLPSLQSFVARSTELTESNMSRIRVLIESRTSRRNAAQ